MQICWKRNEAADERMRLILDASCGCPVAGQGMGGRAGGAEGVGADREGAAGSPAAQEDEHARQLHDSSRGRPGTRQGP